MRLALNYRVCPNGMMRKVMQNDTGTVCHACGADTRAPGYDQRFTGSQALWGYRINADGQHYRVHLCEFCFIQALGSSRQSKACA